MSELLELKFGDHVLITMVGYVVDIRQRWTGCAMENCALVEVDGHEHAVPVRMVLHNNDDDWTDWTCNDT